MHVFWGNLSNLLFHYSSEFFPEKRIMGNSMVTSVPNAKCIKMKYKEYKIYKLFDVTKFILVFFRLSTFRLIQQSLSRTRCWMKSFRIMIKLYLTKSQTTRLKSAKYKNHVKKTTLKMNELQQDESILRFIKWLKLCSLAIKRFWR